MQLRDVLDYLEDNSSGGGDGGPVDWDDVTGKPSTFAPSTHGHAIGDVTGLQTALDGKQAAGSYAAATHGHIIADVTGLQTALNGKQASGSYAAATHTHTASQITDFAAAVALVPGFGGFGGGDPWTYVKLVSNAVTTATGNTATGLAFAPDPLSHYVVEGQLFLQAAATTTGARPGLSWPTGTTQEVGWVLAPTNATAFVSRFWGAPTGANAASTGVSVANEGIFGRIEAQFITGVSPGGSFSVTIATEIAGSEARIMANSWIRYRKLT